MTNSTTRTDVSGQGADAETEAAERWLDQLDPAAVEARDATHVRAVIDAAQNVAAAEQGLRQAVADARAAGDSWTVIGAALGTTRQAAQMRFRAPLAANAKGA